MKLNYRKLKKFFEHRLIEYPVLFRLASKLYYMFNSSFETISLGAPSAILEAFKKAKKFNQNANRLGDYYEFGVFRGGAFWRAYKVCEELEIADTNFYGFDSFKGLPAMRGIDENQKQFFEGQFSCSKARVKQELTKKGIDWSRAILFEGFFKETLTEKLKTKHAFKKVAVAFIDCDLYSSTKRVLTWLNSLLKEGSVLLFDDWYALGNNPDTGQQKALSEFLRANQHYSVEPFMEFPNHGKSFIIHRR